MTLMFAKLSYKIGKAQVEGDNATVSLNLTNTNMVEVREKLKVAALEATLSKRQMTTTEIFKKVLNDSSNKTTSTDTSVKLKKISGKWQIAKDGNEAFGVALLGGMGDLSTLRR